MPEARPEDAAPVEAPLAPDEIAGRSFPNAFRGFDPVEVRAFLGRVADELRAAHLREVELRRTIESAGDVAAVPAVDPDVAAAAAAEAEATLAAAREEADRLVRDAKERVAQLGAAASAETTRVLDDARA